MLGHRRPRGKSTNLKADLLKDRSVGKAVRISKLYRLSVARIDLALDWKSQFFGQIVYDRRKKHIAEKNFSAFVRLFVERILFGVASLFPRLVYTVSEDAPVKDQVYIFRKAFYQIICF